MKRKKSKGKSARNGNATSPYEKFNKQPFSYKDDRRTVKGELVYKANDKLGNKYG